MVQSSALRLLLSGAPWQDGSGILWQTQFKYENVQSKYENQYTIQSPPYWSGARFWQAYAKKQLTLKITLLDQESKAKFSV